MKVLYAGKMPIKTKFKKWIIAKKRKTNKTYNRNMYVRRDDTIARVQERETGNTGNTIHYRWQHIKLISTNTKQSHLSRVI